MGGKSRSDAPNAEAGEADGEECLQAGVQENQGACTWSISVVEPIPVRIRVRLGVDRENQIFVYALADVEGLDA